MSLSSGRIARQQSEPIPSSLIFNRLSSGLYNKTLVEDYSFSNVAYEQVLAEFLLHDYAFGDFDLSTSNLDASHATAPFGCHHDVEMQGHIDGLLANTSGDREFGQTSANHYQESHTLDWNTPQSPEAIIYPAVTRSTETQDELLFSSIIKPTQSLCQTLVRLPESASNSPEYQSRSMIDVSPPAPTLNSPSTLTPNRRSNSRIEKRQRNTEAARRYRQRKVDKVSELEEALRDMAKERDELRLRLARAEAEADVLRSMVGK